MKLFYCTLMLVFVAGVALLPSTAQAMRFCEFKDPKYQVKMATTKTRYIRGKSARDLTEAHTGRSGNNVGGLGGGEMGFKVATKFEIMEQRGQYCVGLTHVKVTLYAKPQIHIASNFKRGTCEYSAVLGHEQKHIRTMRKFMREYAIKFKKKVKRISKTARKHIGPVSNAEVGAAQEELQNNITRQVTLYFNKIMPILRSRQKAVDSRKEYARVFAKCKNWDKKFAKSR